MDVSNTRDHNLAILAEFGFIKYANTTVFHKGELSLISPAVSENTDGGYWFDLRSVNIDRLSKQSYLFVRIVPDLFILQPLNSISELISPTLMENRPNSGNVWGLGLEPDTAKMCVNLFNKKSKSKTLHTKLLTYEEAKEELKALVQTRITSYSNGR